MTVAIRPSWLQKCDTRRLRPFSSPSASSSARYPAQKRSTACMAASENRRLGWRMKTKAAVTPPRERQVQVSLFSSQHQSREHLLDRAWMIFGIAIWMSPTRQWWMNSSAEIIEVDAPEVGEELARSREMS
jgi:hypothetical protein